MISKLCWSLPGRSMESRARRIANTTTMMIATRISVASDVDQGRSAVFCPASDSTVLATPARWSLNRAVSQGSCSGIYEFDQDFQDHGGRGHKQTHQSSRQTDFGKLQYSIRAQSQQQVAKPQQHRQPGARGLTRGRFAQRVDGPLEPMEIQPGDQAAEQESAAAAPPCDAQVDGRAADRENQSEAKDPSDCSLKIHRLDYPAETCG